MYKPRYLKKKPQIQQLNKGSDYFDYGFLWNEPEKVLIINGQKEENVVKAVITIAPCQVIKVELEKLILEPNIGVIDKVDVETKGVWPLAENITAGTIDENTVNDVVKVLNLKSYNTGIADLIL